VGREHERCPGRDLTDVLDEDHPELPEAFDDDPVVDTIQANALMAISTPAQKPRGEASRTSSTSTLPRYVAAVYRRSSSTIARLCPSPVWWR
jgi:hypothetical protein